MNTSNQFNDFTEIKSSLNKLFEETLAAILHKDVDKTVEFARQFLKSYESYYLSSKKLIDENSVQGFLFENMKLCDNVFELLENQIDPDENNAITDVFQTMLTKSYDILEHIPETSQISKLIENHVQVNGGEKKPANVFTQALKNIVYKIKPDRKKINSEKQSIDQFRHYPNRNFFFHFLVVENIRKQFFLVARLYKEIAEFLDYLFNSEKNRYTIVDNLVKHDYVFAGDESVFDIDKEKIASFITAIENTYHEITSGINDNIDKFLEKFNRGEMITLEEPVSKINIRRNSSSLTSDFSKVTSNWRNTVFLLSEDWKLDLEVNSLKYYTLKEYFDFSKTIHSNFNKPGAETLNQMVQWIAEIKSKIESIDQQDPMHFEESLNAIKIEIKRKLVLKAIPTLTEIIIKADIATEIDNVESDSLSKFEKISKKRYIIKNPDYSKPIERSEFETISPYALLSYEMLPGLKKVFPELKTTFIAHVGNFELNIKEIPEMIDFTIESALSFFEKEQKIAEALKLSTEGINRAENKLEELIEVHNSFIQEKVKKLKTAIEEFTNEINEITDNESALQIKIRVAKLQAIERSRKFKEKMTSNIRNFLPIALEYLKKGLTFLKLSSEKIRKQLLSSQTESFISSDTSDFLAETEAAISQLPFIYQRLFKIEPLSSFELYIPRETPMEKLVLAYNKWKDGKFAPVVVIGEKGSGKTTFVTKFIKSGTQHKDIYIKDLHEINKNPEAIFDELKELVYTEEDNPEKKDAETDDNEEKKMIIFVDGMERLFTTSINGFDYLKKTMHMISETNHRVFWIFSCHLYSWQYLDRVYQISDYFGYHIKLTDLTPKDLITIIEKRHNISGYKIIFEPDQVKKAAVNIKKVNDQEHQAELKSHYFNDLKEINKGNIAQAFLHWLRSANRIEEDTIYIKRTTELETNFLKSVSQEKLVTLRYIVIQNGLTAEDFSRTFRKTIESGYLHLDQLLDDGLVIKKNNYYFINPLIYSQVINGLSRVNLLQ